jgi:hypothetical protein
MGRCPQSAVGQGRHRKARGGARVIYFFHDLATPLYLVYAKAVRTDISPDAKKAVREFAEWHQASPSTANRTEKQMNKFSKDLIKSLGEAADHAEGRASSARVQVVEVPDVRAIRRKLHL